MRNGRLLTEKSPSELYEEFSTSSLNDVVLKLCYNDDVTPVVSNPRSKSSGSTSIKQLLRRISSTSLKSQNTDIPVNSNSFARVRSLIRKNIVVLTRNLL
jgi:prophage DNA circulation protein